MTRSVSARSAAVSSKKKNRLRFRHPNKNARVLCRHNELTFYDDGTFRSRHDYIDDLELARWRVVPFPETDHNMLFYSHYNEGEFTKWRTNYRSDNDEEIALGNAVASAMLNHEMKKVLTGQYDEAPKPDKM